MFLADGGCTVTGPAKGLCSGPGSTPAPSTDNPADPITQVAHATADAAAWAARTLGDAVGHRAVVDYTNTSWVKQYAIVFAASMILTMLLWLLGVAKRAVRGVPMGTALGEAVGLLWLAVAASAFTPAILYVLVSATASISDALARAISDHPGRPFDDLANTLQHGHIGGGPVMLIIVSLVTILICGALWLLLALRALALYLGALMAPVVQAGLVDRDLWGRVKNWLSSIAMLILVEPLMVIMLGLSAVLETSKDHGTIATGIGIGALTVGACLYIAFKIPGTAEALRVARATGRGAVRATQALTPSASGTVREGISTHAGRDDASARVNGHDRSSGGPGGGMQAHSSRNPRPPADD